MVPMRTPTALTIRLVAVVVVSALVFVSVYLAATQAEVSRARAMYRDLAATGDVAWVRGMVARDDALVGAVLKTPDQRDEALGEPGPDPMVLPLTAGRTLELTISRVPMQRRAAGSALLACGCLVFGFAVTAPWWAQPADVRAARQQRSALEALVRMRTQDVRAALREARNADLAKSRFLASMSHEIRTPLNAVLGLAETLTGRLQDPEDERLARVIRDSAQGLLALVNNVLDFSKGAAGKLHLASEPIDPVQLLDGVAAILRPLADEKGLALEHRVEDGVPARFLGDGVHLRQLLINLGSNAIRYTDTGRVVMWVGVTEDVVPRIEIGVRDTGAGIPQAAQERIFDPFIQAEEQSTIGTGLGLAIVRQIVDAMGGTIALHSVPGEGSTFRVALPLRRAGERTVAPRSLERLDQPDRHRTVLVVEDNPVNQMVVTEMLRDTGHEVWTAATGLEALDVLSDRVPDLILMDCQMPGLDGYETTRRIRAGDVGDAPAQVRIVALTAHALPEDRQRCLDAGMDDYLTKPITRNVLMRALARSGRSQRAPVPLTLDDVFDEVGHAPYTTFLDGLEQRLRDLSVAEQEDRSSDVAMLAHALKGSSAQLGLDRLARAAADLERAAAGGTADAEKVVVVKLEAERAREVLISRIPGLY